MKKFLYLPVCDVFTAGYLFYLISLGEQIHVITSYSLPQILVTVPTMYN